MNRSRRDNLAYGFSSFMAAAPRRAIAPALFAVALLLATTTSASDDAAAVSIILVSTRPLGVKCVAEDMSAGLRCERLAFDGGQRRWSPTAWPEVAAEFAEPLPTIIYVHGNRVSPGEDKQQGLAFYRSLAASRPPGRLRYVIWSWPADQIRGPAKDYAVKAARTKPVGWQLAWAVNQLPPQSPVTLVGYSYGARVVTGALHLLGGGNMGELKLYRSENALRPPLRAALVAAALDADWLRPGGYHGLAVGQVESMILINNQLDPAMRFYHLAAENRRTQALGFAGVRATSSWGDAAGRIQSIDVTNSVGRHHAISEYLSHAGGLRRAWEQLLPAAPTPAEPTPAMVEQAVAQRDDAGS